MTIEQLRAVQSAKPFRAYVLHLADGREVRVRSPEFLSVSQGGRTIAVSHEGDAFEIIDLLLVTSIHVGDGRPTRP